MSNLETPIPDTLPGATFLMGPPGAGKTGSVLSFVEAGLNLYFLATEANGVEILQDTITRYRKEGRPVDISKVHWHTVAPTIPDWDTMWAKFTLANSMSVAEMQKKESGLDRHLYTGMRDVIKACKYMPCARTGQNLGNLAEKGDDWVFVCDSLTGLSTMGMQMVKGNRPTMTQPEFGVAQEAVYDLVSRWCALNCFFVLIAHIERERDEITGRSIITASTIGKALAPKLPPLFSEVVGAYKDGTDFFWKTHDMDMALKHRSLPLSDKISPSFVPIVERHRERKALAMEVQPTAHPAQLAS
jgi:hypothetical protein